MLTLIQPAKPKNKFFIVKPGFMEISLGIPHWPSYPLRTYIFMFSKYIDTHELHFSENGKRQHFAHISQRLFLKGGGRAAQNIARRQGGTNNREKTQDTTKDLPGNGSGMVLGFSQSIQGPLGFGMVLGFSNGIFFRRYSRTSRFWDGPWIC